MKRTQKFGRWLVFVTPLLCILLLPGESAAHAYLDRSSPEENAILSTPPDQVQMWFVQAVEPEFTTVRLVDSQGNEIETGEIRIGASPEHLIIPITGAMADDTYTVQWRNISSVDGHPIEGFFTFTIGSEEDVVLPAATSGSSEESTNWLDAVGRWLGFLGIGAAVGALPCWFWVIRPSLRDHAESLHDRVAKRLEILVFTGLGVAILGSTLSLIAQVQRIEEGITPSGIWHALIELRVGGMWSLRVALIGTFAAALLQFPIFHRGGSNRVRDSLVLGVAAASLIPFTLSSHSAALTASREVAVAADWMHLAGSSVWVGGLLALFGGLALPLRREREGAGQILARAIPAFSTLAIVSIIILTITGLYATWQHVGNLEALRSTQYGQALLVKLALIVPLLALGGLNFKVIGPKMRQVAGAPRMFRRAVAAEITLAIAVLFIVGVLTSLAPARLEFTQSTNALSFNAGEAGLSADLDIAPGVAGPNRYSVDLSGETTDQPEDMDVLLRVAPEGTAEGGVQEIELLPDAEGNYSAQSSDIGVAGDWNLELIVRRPGEADWRNTWETAVGTTPTQVASPSQPPEINGYLPAAALLASGVALVCLVVLLRHPAPSRPAI